MEPRIYDPFVGLLTPVAVLNGVEIHVYIRKEPSYIL